MTELVIVLVLIGIVAVIALPRLNLDAFDHVAYNRELTNVLRTAQKIAIGSACEVEVVIDSNGYSVDYTGNPGAPCASGLDHPSRGGVFTGEGQAASTATFVFDGRGRSGGGSVSLPDGSSVNVASGSGYVSSSL